MSLQEDLEQLTQLFFIRQQQKIEKIVRNALRYLDNTRYLERSALAKLMAETWQIYLDGSSLQQILTQAIESVKLFADQATWSRWQLRHDILTLTYYEKMNPSNIALRLSISERQYYRELRVAIHTVAQYLVDLH
ncbi:MAG: hypothetical protein JW953_22130 [Anaerolineae bacterium]|nr:hypothetical protein [Anaerolineae bacterium]